VRPIALILLLPSLKLAAQLPLFVGDPQAVYQAAKETTGPRDTGAYIIDLEMNIRVEDSGKMHWTQRSLTRVVDDRGVRQFGMLMVPWVDWRQDRPRIKARVITRDGRAHDLEAGTIVDGTLSHGGGNQLLTDTKALSAALPMLQPDSVIEAEMALDDKASLFPGGQFVRYPLTQSTPILHYRVTVETPPDSPFHATASGLQGAKRTEAQTAELRTVVFEGGSVPAPHPLSMLPPDEHVFPTISISSGVTWRNLSAWYSRIVDDRAGPLVAREIAPSDALARINAILAEIQLSVRYTGLELGAGAYMPRAPEETLKRGFGDCKDKSVLLIQRLRAAGIPAFLALLTPYPAPDVDPDLPGIEGFSHAIVYVPAEHPLWIDPTAEYTPATRLPFMDQGRLTLVASPQATQLIRTPESKAEDNLTRFDITIRLQPEGEGSFEMKEDETGAFEELIRPIAAMSPEQVREQKATGLKRKINVEVGDPHDLASPFKMSVYGEGYDASRTDSKRAWADVSPLGVDTGFLAALAQDASLLREPSELLGPARTEDYCFPVTFTEEMEKRIVPPPGYRLEWPPALPWRQIGPLTLSRTAKLDSDGAVRLSYRLVSTKRCYTVQEARTIAQEIHQLSTSRDATVRIEFVK